IVTMEALEPYRCGAFARAADDPKPLPYLFDAKDQAQGGLDIEVTLQMRTETMRAKKEKPVQLSHGNFRDSYWTMAQIVAHHASNGCNLQPGDLLGSGTISGTEPGTCGSMMELTQGGKKPVELASGQSRAFIEDGDEIVLRGRC